MNLRIAAVAALAQTHPDILDDPTLVQRYIVVGDDGLVDVLDTLGMSPDELSAAQKLLRSDGEALVTDFALVPEPCPVPPAPPVPLWAVGLEAPPSTWPAAAEPVPEWALWVARASLVRALAMVLPGPLADLQDAQASYVTSAASALLDGLAARPDITPELAAHLTTLLVEDPAMIAFNLGLDALIQEPPVGPPTGVPLAPSALTTVPVTADMLVLEQDAGGWQDSAPTTGPNGGIVLDASRKAGTGRRDGPTEGLGYGFGFPAGAGFPTVPGAKLVLVTQVVEHLADADASEALFFGVDDLYGGLQYFAGGARPGFGTSRFESGTAGVTAYDRYAHVALLAGENVGLGLAGTWTGHGVLNVQDGSGGFRSGNVSGKARNTSAKAATALRGSIALTHGSTTSTTVDQPLNGGEHGVSVAATVLDLAQAIPLTIANLPGGGVPEADPESVVVSLTEADGVFTLVVNGNGVGLVNDPSLMVRWLLDLPAPRRDDGTQGVYVLMEPLTGPDGAGSMSGVPSVGAADNGGLSSDLVSWNVIRANPSVQGELSIVGQFGYLDGRGGSVDGDSDGIGGRMALIRLPTAGLFESASGGDGALVSTVMATLDANGTPNGVFGPRTGSRAQLTGLQGQGRAFLNAIGSIPAGTYTFRASVLYVDELPASMSRQPVP